MGVGGAMQLIGECTTEVSITVKRVTLRNTVYSLGRYISHFRQIQTDWWVYITKVSTEQRAFGERSLAVHSLGQSASAFEALQCICSLMMWSFLFSECTLCHCAFWYFLVIVGTLFLVLCVKEECSFLLIGVDYLLQCTVTLHWWLKHYSFDDPRVLSRVYVLFLALDALSRKIQLKSAQ